MKEENDETSPRTFVRNHVFGKLFLYFDLLFDFSNTLELLWIHTLSGKTSFYTECADLRKRLRKYVYQTSMTGRTTLFQQTLMAVKTNFK